MMVAAASSHDFIKLIMSKDQEEELTPEEREFAERLDEKL